MHSNTHQTQSKLIFLRKTLKKAGHNNSLIFYRKKNWNLYKINLRGDLNFNDFLFSLLILLVVHRERKIRLYIYINRERERKSFTGFPLENKFLQPRYHCTKLKVSFHNQRKKESEIFQLIQQFITKFLRMDQKINL